MPAFFVPISQIILATVAGFGYSIGVKKLQTIDDFCGQPHGSFKKFIKRQEAEERAREESRQQRIRASRKKK